MSSSRRGGGRLGAGRRPKSNDIQAIITECYSVRAWFTKKQGARAWHRQWSQFKTHAIVQQHRQDMKKWSPSEHHAASHRPSGKLVIGAMGARQTLADVRAILKERTGLNGQRLGGAHSVSLPRLYGVRRATFELVARRLKRRHGWQIGASRVERVWKKWEHLNKLS